MSSNDLQMIIEKMKNYLRRILYFRILFTNFLDKFKFMSLS